jgi:hypothetical protein
MRSIQQLQSKLKEFHTYAHKGTEEAGLQRKWEELFETPLTNLSAKSFVQYYKDMRSPKNTKKGGKRTRKQQKQQKQQSRHQRGGSATILSPAALDYQLVPGANVTTYGRFPIEAGTDASSIRDMDVYFNSGMSRGCGIENSSRQVPASMGSNKVGGRRNRTRKQTQRQRQRQKQAQKQAQAGGNLLESLASHPYLSGAPPNSVQVAANMWSGNTQTIPAPASPAAATWSYVGRGAVGLIDPGLITPIGSDFSKLASPPAWQRG